MPEDDRADLQFIEASAGKIGRYLRRRPAGMYRDQSCEAFPVRGSCAGTHPKMDKALILAYRERLFRAGGFPLRITSLLFAAAVAAVVVLPSSAFAQNPRCEALRLACENKDFLGMRGMGTCREYRETCGAPVYEVNCRELRYQCMHKEELGLEGQGTCQRYRESCR